jgi:aryl-alcohol dehydrogenase-like predicted oxidoreductase
MFDDAVSRREFLRAGAAAGVTAAALPALAEDPPAKPKDPVLVPKRKLGKTGVEVSILNQGTGGGANVRHLNVMHEEGVRYIDTADCYKGGKAEKTTGEWLEQIGRRKEYFVVTKAHPRTPEQWVQNVDERLKALRTDYIDLFFIHGLGDNDYGSEACRDWPKDKAWAAAAEKMKKSGKVRLVGFSTHCRPIELRIALLNHAAEGGWVDAIMVATSPLLMRDTPELNKALDKCHKAGVGLISMKECKGAGGIKEIIPDFEAKGLNAYTAVLTAMWSDERFASICSHMDNINKLKENAAAARNFKPLNEKEMAAVADMLRGAERTYCDACDGSCQRAAGTQADLNAIARYVSYVEENGQRADARALFAALPPEARDLSGADLHAATHACKCHVDFARVVQKAREYFA